jgi:hypothetical protein
MTADHGDQNKATAWIDSETYNIVMEKFHHGQQTIFLRKIYDSIKILIERNEFDKITDYLYKKEDLTLPGN